MSMQTNRLLIVVMIGITTVTSGQVIMKADSNRSKRLFPLMHGLVDRAKAQGAEFPKPYGLAISSYYQRMEMGISRLDLAGIALDPQSGLINFGQSEIKNTVISSQARADVWVLPFVNVYGMLGRVSTFNNINLQLNLNGSAIPGIGAGDVKLLERQEIANINGRVMAVGTVVAGGYEKIFANVNITYAKTYLEEVNSFQTALVVFPMVGMSTKFANLFVGAIYQDTGQQNRGSFLGTNGTVIPYSIRYDASLWNYTVGLNKSIGNWTVVVVQGFGDRTNSVIEVGYRFGD